MRTSRGLSLQSKSMALLVIASGTGALIGFGSRSGPVGDGWPLALMVLTAAVVAVAEQTLP